MGGAVLTFLLQVLNGLEQLGYKVSIYGIVTITIGGFSLDFAMGGQSLPGWGEFV